MCDGPAYLWGRSTEDCFQRNLKIFEPFFGESETAFGDPNSTTKLGVVTTIRSGGNGQAILLDIKTDGEPSPHVAHNLYFRNPENQRIRFTGIDSGGAVSEGFMQKGKTDGELMEIQSAFDGKGTLGTQVVTWKLADKDAMEITFSLKTGNGEKAPDSPKLTCKRIK